MSRIKSVKTEEASGELKTIYEGLENKMGRVLNIFSNMGNSPAVLKGFLGLSEAASQTSLDPKLREEIALIAAQTNQCQYCLSAHTQLAKGAGIESDDILQARLGESKDPKKKAILHFAKNVIEKRGNVSNQEIEQLKKAGVSDAEIVEIIMHIVLNIFTNYFNLVTDPEVDFPAAPKLPV